MDGIGVGIIGFGRIGAEHAGWIGQTRQLRVAVVADPTPARRDLAASRGFTVVEDPERLLADPAVQVVLISTPTSMHFDLAMRAVAAGKHVMVEKPMALDLAQSRQMVEAARRRGVVLSVFHNRRWDADYLTVKRAVDEGVFGRLINVESRLGQWGSCVGPAAREYRPGWRNEAGYGGGGLYDWGSHFIDQLWQLLLPARPVRVFAQLRGNVWTTDCDDFARVCIDFDSGACGMVEINTTTQRPGPRWHLDGTAGSAESPHSLEFDVERWADVKFRSMERNERPLPRAAGGATEVDIWEQFGAAAGGRASPAVLPETVLMTMQLLDAARRSSATGTAVEIGR